SCTVLPPSFLFSVLRVTVLGFFFFSSRRRHTRSKRDWSSDVCSSDLHYAATKDVSLLLWYNSSGSWNKTTYHPKSQLLTHEDRRSEERRVGKECKARGGPEH